MGKTLENFSRFDAADYLVGIEDAAAYLDAALEEAGDDPAAVAQALGAIARSGNLNDLARLRNCGRPAT
ncbi:MAG: hypothetical protein LBV34_05370 [Nocardiopsaceae bacterium]|nr:hypothetical protein [Nocardiopsaceae bacterium]